MPGLRYDTSLVSASRPFPLFLFLSFLFFSYLQGCIWRRITKQCELGVCAQSPIKSRLQDVLICLFSKLLFFLVLSHL
ncbi:hypothetical protein V8C37DRAFT_381775 [Trichoderma ceciliae]